MLWGGDYVVFEMNYFISENSLFYPLSKTSHE